jgi:hypothetical protein
MLKAVLEDDEVVASPDVAAREQRAVRIPEALLHRPGDSADDEVGE